MTTSSVVLIALASYLVWGSALGLIPAVLARSKGRSFAAWWAVAVLGFGIFTVIPVLLLRTQRCPHCREVVNPHASLCPHCRSALPVTVKIASANPTPQSATWWTAAFILTVLGVLVWGVAASADPLPWWGVATTIGLGVPLAVALIAWVQIEVKREHGG